MDAFVVWLNAEVQRRGWSYSEAARRGGFAPSMFTHIANGSVNPGLDFCRGVSRAFGVPLEDVFRLAGILPALGDENPSVAQLIARLNSLAVPVRQQVIDIITAALDLAQSSSVAPAIQFQSRDDFLAYVDALPDAERREWLEAAERTFGAVSSESDSFGAMPAA